MFWNVYGECDNFAMLMGHTNAITDMHFSTDGSALYTASADKTVMCWDTTSGTRVKKLKGERIYRWWVIRNVLVLVKGGKESNGKGWG